MKTALRLSISLNGCLVVLLVFLALKGRAPVAAPEPAGELAATTAGAEPKPFHWSQLESSDYRTYIANLRSIGCPEQTVHDIITADVGSLFASTRQPWEAELRSLSNDPPGAHSDSRPAVEAELLRLRYQETRLLAALLDPQAGDARGPAETVAEVPAASKPSRQSSSQADAAVSMPLVFQDVDLAALKLDSGQRQAIEDLRQRFVEQLGGPNQDPTEPAYQERWQQAQPENDGLLRGLIGVRAWQDYQLAASHESMSSFDLARASVHH